MTIVNVELVNVYGVLIEIKKKGLDLLVFMDMAQFHPS